MSMLLFMLLVCLLVAGYHWCPLEQSLHIHMLQVSQKPFHEECHHSYDMHDSLSLSGFTFKVIWRLFDCWRLCIKLATKKLFLNRLTSFPGMIVSAWHNGHSSSVFHLDTMDTSSIRSRTSVTDIFEILQESDFKFFHYFSRSPHRDYATLVDHLSYMDRNIREF